jgi:catalase
MIKKKVLTKDTITLNEDNLNSMTAGPKGKTPVHDVNMIEKLMNIDHGFMHELLMQANDSDGDGYIKTMYNITKYRQSKYLSEIGKHNKVFVHFPVEGLEKKMSLLLWRFAEKRKFK